MVLLDNDGVSCAKWRHRGGIGMNLNLEPDHTPPILDWGVG